MDKKRTKKYPVLTYLCLTLFVCVMFTGVTFSRYTGMQSGNIDTAVSHFACSYDVTDVSATSFINSYYYVDANDPASGNINTLRTVTYTVRNYKKGEESAPSGEGLKSVLRISGPYEFISNLAWQFECVNGNMNTVVSPQIVMSDMIANAPSKVWNTCESLETNKSKSFDARPYGGGTQVSLSGDITDGKGTLTGSWKASDSSTAVAGEFVLSVYSLNASYSLTYLRAEKIDVTGETSAPGKATSPIFIDVTENTVYCTLDIYLPNEMDFPAGQSAEKSFTMSFTIVNAIEAINNQFTHFYDTDSEGKYVFKNNASGYHYDATVAVRNESGVAETDESGAPLVTASVRVKRTGDVYSYFKLTNGSSRTVTETPLTDFTDDKKYVKDGTDYYAVADLNNYLRSAEAAVSGKGNDYIIGSCTDKAYGLNFKTLFLQITENGGSK